MISFTLPTYNQIFGLKKEKIFGYCPNAATTDFAVLLGIDTCRDEQDGFDFRGINLKYRTGPYWTKSYDEDNLVIIVTSIGLWGKTSSFYKNIGIRPMFSYDSIEENLTEINDNNIKKIELGYYPQQAPGKTIQTTLENVHKNGQLIETGNTYTTAKEQSLSFVAKIHKEYEYNGKRYVRVTANSSFVQGYFQLSNREYYKNGDPIWIEVEPVTWLVDKRANLAISERVIIAGVEFDHRTKYSSEYFDYSDYIDIKKFMNRYLVKDLFQNNQIVQNMSKNKSRIKML